VIQPVIGGQPLTYRVKRNFGYSAVDLGSQAQFSLFNNSIALVGGEYTYDRERIRTNTFISNSTNAQLDGGTPPIQPFTNAAGYAQALFRELGWLQLSGNLRYDYNNHSAPASNYHAGLIRTQRNSASCSPAPRTEVTPEQLYAGRLRRGRHQVAGASDPQSWGRRHQGFTKPRSIAISVRDSDPALPGQHILHAGERSDRVPPRCSSVSAHEHCAIDFYWWRVSRRCSGTESPTHVDLLSGSVFTKRRRSIRVGTLTDREVGA
jgi:hypothetical protein